MSRCRNIKHNLERKKRRNGDIEIEKRKKEKRKKKRSMEYGERVGRGNK